MPAPTFGSTPVHAPALAVGLRMNKLGMKNNQRPCFVSPRNHTRPETVASPALEWS